LSAPAAGGLNVNEKFNTQIAELPVKESENTARDILMSVYAALTEKGYNPVSQIVGYILSGDPTYITSYQGARSLIGKLERDELLEEIFLYYIEHLAQ
jgi:uncharacterized protein (UPF0297 family)